MQLDRAERSGRGRMDTGRLFADQLTDMLVQPIFGWKPRRDRFMTGDGREWLKREAFQPTKSLDAAFRLLKAIKPVDYKLGGSAFGPCWAKVKLSGTSGEASASSLPVAICLAIAKTLGIEVEMID
jgi:hypothetical protein